MKKSLRGINPASKPSGDGCVECLASPKGWWFSARTKRAPQLDDGIADISVSTALSLMPEACGFSASSVPKNDQRQGSFLPHT